MTFWRTSSPACLGCSHRLCRLPQLNLLYTWPARHCAHNRHNWLFDGGPQLDATWQITANRREQPRLPACHPSTTREKRLLLTTGQYPVNILQTARRICAAQWCCPDCHKIVPSYIKWKSGYQHLPGLCPSRRQNPPHHFTASRGKAAIARTSSPTVGWEHCLSALKEFLPTGSARGLTVWHMSCASLEWSDCSTPLNSLSTAWTSRSSAPACTHTHTQHTHTYRGVQVYTPCYGTRFS
jgi:hypothetical protein